MYQDANLNLSTAQAVTASAVSTNKVPLDVARDVGAGRQLHVAFGITESFATATSVQFQVVTDDDGAGTNLTIIGETDAIAIASLTAGKQFSMPIPRAGLKTVRKYIYTQYNIGGSNATAGKINADIVLDVQDPQTSYASGFSIK